MRPIRNKLILSGLALLILALSFFVVPRPSAALPTAAGVKSSAASPPGISALWNRTFGGDSQEYGEGVVECSGGGFAIVGRTYSFGATSGDAWLVRTDANGNHLWNHSYGGTESDGAFDIVECSGGGFAIAGGTGSFSPGGFWLIRTDANGNHLWNHSYRSGSDGRSLVECAGGGFAIAGQIETWSANERDIWLLRTDANGNSLWNATFGGVGMDLAYSLAECSTGGFAVFGVATSFGGGINHAWLIRTDAAGNHLWNRTYGDPGTGYGLVECSTGGFALTGQGFGGCYLIRTDNAGNPVWTRVYKGDGRVALSVIEVASGGFVLAGLASGTGGSDAWLVRTDSDGYQLWNQTFGPDFGNEQAQDVIECESEGFAFSGETESYGPGLPCSNIWLVRIPDDRTPPVWVVAPTDETLYYGATVDIQLEAYDSSGIDRWTVNDTSHFAISNTGRLSSLSSLETGEYGLQITVYDPYNNPLVASIKITVIPTPFIPGFPAQAIVFGILFAISIGLLQRKKRLRMPSVRA